MNPDFVGKKVLVTGGTRGIGRAVVEAFAGAGASVAFTYYSSAEQAEALTSELEKRGTEVLSFQGDVASAEQAEEIVDAVIKQWGSLDILVNNAGIALGGLVLRMTSDDWDAVINTNLKGVFNFSKAAYRPMMRQHGGKIINVSSVVGVIGNPGQACYSASKAGIIGFSKSMAKELAGRGVTVNVVAPGYIETDMTDAFDERTREAILGAIPLGRPGSPTDVALSVLFLASPAADYITGHVLHVNGGLAML